jgi:hypothetical protein
MSTWQGFIMTNGVYVSKHGELLIHIEEFHNLLVSPNVRIKSRNVRCGALWQK